jgi:hypothetical protein
MATQAPGMSQYAGPARIAAKGHEFTGTDGTVLPIFLLCSWRPISSRLTNVKVR